MIESILFYLLITVSFINISHIFMYLIGANIYDIKKFKKEYEAKTQPAWGTTPLVTVVIPAHNEENGVEKTLNSVCNSSYGHLQIIVVDDASRDTTRRIVDRYIAAHPHRSIELVSFILNRGKATALNYAISDCAHGEFIMTLDADSVIDKNAVANALRYFSDPKVAGVAANVKIFHQHKPVVLLQLFEHMIGYRSKKFYTVTNSEFVVGGVASTYRYDVLKTVGWYGTDTQTEDIGLSLKIAALGNKANKLVYAEDVIAMTEGVQTVKGLQRQRYRWKLGMIQNLVKFRGVVANTSSRYSRMLTYFRLPMAFVGELMLLFEPVIFGYILYMSIAYSEPGFFIGAYVTMMLYIAFVVWHDTYLNTSRRLQLTAYSPFLYFVFYIMNVIQFVAIVKCLADPHRLVLKKKMSSVWKSPDRMQRTSSATA